MKNESEQFHRRCGEILRMALGVEFALEFFIFKYFCMDQADKEYLLHKFVLNRLGFESKIKIFEEICKGEEIEPEKFRKISKSANFVRETRNRVAHYEAVSDQKKGIRLRKGVIFEKDELKLTKELIEEVDKERLSVIQGMTKIHLGLIERSRESPNVKE